MNYFPISVLAQSLEDYIGTQISSFDVILLLKLVFVHSVLAAQKDVTEKKGCLSCFILSSLFETSSSPDEDIFEEEELEFFTATFRLLRTNI